MRTRRRSPRNPLRHGLPLALAALLVLLLPGPARAEGEAPLSDAPKPSALEIANKGFDLVVLRPVALVATVVGACLFPPAALLAAPGGRARAEEALDVFVRTPWESLATRPLGEF